MFLKCVMESAWEFLVFALTVVSLIKTKFKKSYSATLVINGVKMAKPFSLEVDGSSWFLPSLWFCVDSVPVLFFESREGVR